MNPAGAPGPDISRPSSDAPSPPEDADGSRLKLVLGLGNPGREYDATRHNVGWWVLDRFAYDHGLAAFERQGQRLETAGTIGGREIRLVKPRTYVNRSGLALAELRQTAGFETARDLLVVADDTNLEVGRIRFRPGGGAGGHKGLKSVTAVLGSPNLRQVADRRGTGAPGYRPGGLGPLGDAGGRRGHGGGSAAGAEPGPWASGRKRAWKSR